MQKKLIALAVAGLASTAAFAQSNVQIYGSIDYGYSYRFDDLQGSNLVQKNASSASQFNGGQSAGNRIGFKGTEDLGNGLKAVFLMEQGYSLGTSQDAGSFGGQSFSFTRQAYMGLTGNFGTAIGGRLYTPHYTFVSSLDPFAAGTVGRYNNTYGARNSGASGAGLFDPVRVDNAVAYVSPNFSGFQVTAAYSNNAIGEDSATNSATNNTVYALLGTYTAGKLNAGLSYHYIAAGSNAAIWSDVQTVAGGASYDFGVAKVSGLISYGTQDNTSLNVSSKDATVMNYMLGVSAPFGKHTVKGSFNYSDATNNLGQDAYQLAVGYDYAFSKRTNFYSAYSFIDNDTSARYPNRTGVVGDASNPGGIFQQGLQVGLRHTF